MGSYIYSYFVHYSVQLFICIAFFACVLPRRSAFWVRLLLMLTAYFGAGYGFIELVKLVPDELYPLAILYYVFLFSVGLLMLRGLFRAEFREILFVGTAGYAVQHMTYAAVIVIKFCVLKLGGPDTLGWFVDKIFFNILIYILTGFLCYLLLTRSNIQRGELKRADLRMLALSLSVLLSSVVLSIFLDFQASTTMLIISRIYAIISCGLGLAMQFDLSRRNRLERSNELLEYMLHLERQQHEIARENMDIINIKCHDLKYQITALGDMDSKEERRKSIQELEQSVMIYDSMVKSGNDALDLVLTEKSLLCQKYRIKLSYIVDGEQLSFLSGADIYALFGNALDNAIESVTKVAEDRRIISLRVVVEGEMLLIHLDNYCAEAPAFEEGLPQTTKADKAFHGFGTKSIQYIVQRYGGDLRMSVADEHFNLDILFGLT